MVACCGGIWFNQSSRSLSSYSSQPSITLTAGARAPCRITIWDITSFPRKSLYDTDESVQTRRYNKRGRRQTRSMFAVDRVAVVRFRNHNFQMSRKAAIHRMFELLEHKYGSIEKLIDPVCSRVITCDSLNPAALRDLFSHRACAVRIPGYYPIDAAKELSERLLKQGGQKNWSVSSPRGMESTDVQSIGVPYNVALSGGKDAVDEYFRNSVPFMRSMRSAPRDGGKDGEERVSLTMSPVDKLRLELDEIWPSGANVSKDASGRTHAAGFPRIMRGPTRWMGFCHVDDIAVLRENQGLFSANIYLSLPSTSFGATPEPLPQPELAADCPEQLSPLPSAGGELLVWNVNVRSRWQFYTNAHTLSQLLVQDEQGQRLLRDKFPPPISIPVQAGDLVLLCAQRPHAVQGFLSGSRVSMQSFISFQEGKPLMLDN